MSRRLCAVSVDLDEIAEYCSLHGLREVSEAASVVYELALPRAVEFASNLAIPLTFFAVGRDLERRHNAMAVRALHEQGHRVENHSYGHRYDLTRLPLAEISREVARGQELIAAATGRAPVGFRAPGYTVNDVLFDVLEEQGLRFDASVFPCPPYYLAKAAARAAIMLRGRRSGSVLDTPRAMLAPRHPYRPGRPWHQVGERSLMELPVAVSYPMRLPFIGTGVTLMGAAGARFLARGCTGMELVSFELHGIDFLDQNDGLEFLAPHQFDLRVPRRRKRAALQAAIDELRTREYRFVTLEEAAEQLQG